MDVKFSAADVHESFLIDAAKHTWFFHVLAESSLVGVAPKNADGRMFAVQLPKPDVLEAARRMCALPCHQQRWLEQIREQERQLAFEKTHILETTRLL